MTASSSSSRAERAPPSGGSGPPRRERVSRTGLVLLFLSLASILLGCLALVAAWVRRLGRTR